MTARLIRLDFVSDKDRNFFAKLECDNPTGSLKDRMCYYVLDRLEKEGKIRKGQTIVEASSGNTGIALANAGRTLGYPTIIFCPCSTPSSKIEFIRDQGADVRLIDTSIDPESDIKAAQHAAKDKNVFWFNQFENPCCQIAYYESLGVEVVHQFPKSIDYLVAGVGTGASLLGLGQKVRDDINPFALIYSVGPKSSPTTIGGLHPSHIRGEFKIWKQRPSNFLEAHIMVSDEEAWSYKSLLNEHDVPVGPSSGAVLCASLSINKPGNYLLLFGDNKDRYAH